MLDFLVIGFFGGMLIGVVVCALNTQSVYYLGVRNGYGYSRSPKDAQYKEAGAYLRDHCWEEWPELRDDNKLRVHRLTQYHEKWEDN